MYWDYIIFLKNSPQMILPPCICYAHCNSHVHRLARAAANAARLPLLYVSSSAHEANPCMGMERSESFDNVK